MMRIPRRDFVSAGAVTGGYAALPAWLRETVTRMPSAPLTSETWTPFVCPMCAGGCGLLARIVEGVPVDVCGNPDHPINCGFACPRGQASIRCATLPDRLDLPLIREQASGEESPSTTPAKPEDFYAAEWNEAITLLASRLRKLRSRGEAERVAFVVGTDDDSISWLVRRFAYVYGTPHFYEWRWMFGDGPVDAMRHMLGSSEWTFDLANADLLLSLGADWLLTSSSPVEANRALFELRRTDRMSRILQVDANHSHSAAHADEWIRIKPGSEGAFALGIAAVLVREGSFKRKFVSEKTFGFEDWKDTEGHRHMGFRRYLLEQCDLETTARLTGVEPQVITRIAHELVESLPGLVICDRLPLHEQMSVLALNALIGSIGVKGGLIPKGRVPVSPDVMVSDEHTPPVALPPWAGTLSAESFPEGLITRTIETGLTPIDTIVFFNCNPLHSSPEPDRWAKALASIPFAVTFSSQFNDLARHASLVIPIADPVEGLRDVQRSMFDGTPVVSVTRGQSETQNAPDAGDIFLALACAIGGAVHEAFPWESFEDLVRHRLEPLLEVGEGRALGKPIQQVAGQSFDVFWKDVTSAGGWGAKAHEASVPKRFETTSGRFEFIARSVKGGKDVAHLPHLEAPAFAGSGQEYPLHLMVYLPPAFYGGKEESPWLQLLSADSSHRVPSTPLRTGRSGQVEEFSGDVARIHSSVAERLKIRDNDEILIETIAGSVIMRARIDANSPPDIISVPLGRDHIAQGLWQGESPVNGMGLVRAMLDATTGHPMWNHTRARVTPIEPPSTRIVGAVEPEQPKGNESWSTEKEPR